MDSEALARLRLFAAIEGGSVPWTRLISELGAEAVVELIEESNPRTSSVNIGSIKSRLAASSASELISEVERAGAFFLLPTDPDWPTQLNDLAASPIGLMVKGNRSSLSRLSNSLAIVGTRNPSNYGSRIASDFAFGAGDRGWSVISGGAYGIDSVAHKGALLNEGTTCAVLASGFNQSYPAGNLGLFEEICEEGVLISEVMPHVRAEPFRFLTRNRLIAALSQATIVIEAAYRSGSLRTARDAAEIFRYVFAVPGPITSPTSEGCHRLIAERSAELVTSIAEVFEVVSPLNVK